MADDASRYDTAGCSSIAGLWLPGTSGAYASTPDTSDADVSSTLTVAVDCALLDWTSGAAQTLVAKYLSTGNQISWRFLISSTGMPQFAWSTDGTSGAETFATATTAVPAADGERIALRVVFDLNDGSGHYRARFYYITGGSDDLSGSAPWVLLDTVTGGSTTTIFSSSASITVGTRDTAGVTANATGLIRQVDIIAAGVVAATFSDQSTGTTTFSQSGEPWTVNGSAKIYRRVTTGTDTAMVVYTTLGQPWTTAAGDLPMDLRCSGAVLRVTAVTGTGPTQLLTISSTPVNGVAKALAPGEDVSLAQPAVYAL